MSAEIIELEDVDGLGAGAVGEPGQRAFYIQARTENTQLTVLVEKEQVDLLSTEAVAFLDKIADTYPELPFDLPATQSALREPTVPLFRARLIGLGFDPERELVLIELRERSEDEEAEDDNEEDGYVARIYATRARLPGETEARQPSVVSLGVRPQFGSGKPRLVEVYLLDASLDLYGEPLLVEFVARLRGEERFASVEALQEQIEKDVAAARQVLTR